MKRSLAVLGALLAVLAVAFALAIAVTHPTLGATVRDPMCGRYDSALIHGDIIEADSYGGQPECVRYYTTRPAFAVVSSGIADRGQVQAYPHIVVTSPPARVVRAGGHLTWRVRTAGVRGLWAAGAECWITRRRAATRSGVRAELMIWVTTAPLLYRHASRKVVVRVDGTRWFVLHWGRPSGGSWNYVQFRRVRPVTHVRRLALAGFFRAAVRLGYVHRRWYQQSWEAGFEIWRGGQGLAVTRLRVTA